MRMENSTPENVRKSLQAIGEAADHGADLVFFPEVQFTPFFPQYEKVERDDFAFPPDHEYVRRIIAAAKERAIIVSPNLYLEENGKRYDASLFISAHGDVQGVSKMVHIMQCDCFYEQDYYAPSDDGFKVYATPWGNVGIVICFDRHVPESVRTCVARGADLILIPTANVEGEPLEMFEWEIRVQAMQSSVYIAMCNRVGREDKMNFIGRSLVVDPNGDVVARADEREQILYADIDPGKSRATREAKPYFRLRRPDMYE